jgi:hypothetical protein
MQRKKETIYYKLFIQIGANPTKPNKMVKKLKFLHFFVVLLCNLDLGTLINEFKIKLKKILS